MRPGTLDTSKMVITVKPWDPDLQHRGLGRRAATSRCGVLPVQGQPLRDRRLRQHDQQPDDGTRGVGQDMPAAPPRTSVLVPRAPDRAVRPAHDHGVMRTLLVAVAVALALAVAAVAQAAPAAVSASQLKSGFRKATGQKLVVDTIRSLRRPLHGVQPRRADGNPSGPLRDVHHLSRHGPRRRDPGPDAAHGSAHRRARHAGGRGHLLGARPDDERHRGLAREAPVRGERRPLVDELEAGQEDGRHVHDPPQGSYRLDARRR